MKRAAALHNSRHIKSAGTEAYQTGNGAEELNTHIIRFTPWVQVQGELQRLRPQARDCVRFGLATLKLMEGLQTSSSRVDHPRETRFET